MINLVMWFFNEPIGGIRVNKIIIVYIVMTTWRSENKIQRNTPLRIVK